MALPATGTAPLSTPSHRAEHARLVTAADTDMPQGIVAYRWLTAGIPALTPTYIDVAVLPGVPVRTGRLYRWCFMARAWNNAIASAAYLNLKTAQTPSAVTGTTDLVIDALSYLQPSANYGSVQWQQPFRAPNGTITITIQARATGGNIWLDNNNCATWVEDIGPDRGRQ